MRLTLINHKIVLLLTCKRRLKPAFANVNGDNAVFLRFTLAYSSFSVVTSLDTVPVQFEPEKR